MIILAYRGIATRLIEGRILTSRDPVVLAEGVTDVDHIIILDHVRHPQEIVTAADILLLVIIADLVLEVDLVLEAAHVLEVALEVWISVITDFHKQNI